MHERFEETVWIRDKDKLTCLDSPVTEDDPMLCVEFVFDEEENETEIAIFFHYEEAPLLLTTTYTTPWKVYAAFWSSFYETMILYKHKADFCKTLRLLYEDRLERRWSKN